MLRLLGFSFAVVLFGFVLTAPPAVSQTDFTDAEIDSIYAEYPDFVRDAVKKVGLVWQGNRRYITYEELAAYCAPILWFSPDEPLLHGTKGPDILLPEVMPFEVNNGAPVSYYRIKKALARRTAGDAPLILDEDPRRYDTVIDLETTAAVDLEYFFYYSKEAGLAAHPHDLESVQMKVFFLTLPENPEMGYWIVVQRVVGKAHGIIWYDNILEVSKYTNFPMHILVEEGKHASCTDQNGDGEYSPGYDVSRQVNDAWGVRDNMREGHMFTGGFTSFMAKRRPPEYRVFPPLPEDSPNREKHSLDGVYAPDNAIYEVRPFPFVAAAGEDPHLTHFIESKGSEDWPEIVRDTSIKKFGKWAQEDSFWKSLSLAYRWDKQSGISLVFPLLIFKNVADPIGGGWFVNRVYAKDKNLRDIAWNLMYATSASRWIDTYFAAGVEWDNDGFDTEAHFMVETGVKMRMSVSHSPLKFLSGLTDFWGVRVGVKNYDVTDWSYLGYIVEVGAGNF